MKTFVEILGCDGTALYESVSREIKFSTSGRLEVSIAYDGILMLKLNQFEYTIKPSTEILCDRHDPQFKMVLYLKKYQIYNAKWILKLNQHVDEVYSCLSEKCHVVDKQPEKQQYSSAQIEAEEKLRVKQQQSYTKNQKKEKKYESKQQKINKQKQQEEEPGLQIKQNPITAKGVLVGASKGLSWGLKMTGKVLSKGFEAVGGLASKAVKPAADKVEVSQNAKANIEFAKKTSKTVLGFAASQVGNLITFGKETVSNIGERFEKTEKGKQMQQSPKYEMVKEGTKTGVQVVSNIYEGVVTAVYEIGSGIGKGTSKVVGAKYGDQAGQAADGVFEGVGNVIKIARIPQDETAKALK